MYFDFFYLWKKVLKNKQNLYILYEQQYCVVNWKLYRFQKHLFISTCLDEDANTSFKDQLWLFIWEFSETIFYDEKWVIFLWVIFEKKKTSKIKNQRLNCKTTDLGKDAHTIFLDQLWLFIWEFSETKLHRILGEYYTKCCNVDWEVFLTFRIQHSQKILKMFKNAL